VGECFFLYQATRVVPDKRPLNGVCACERVRVCVCVCVGCTDVVAQMIVYTLVHPPFSLLLFSLSIFYSIPAMALLKFVYCLGDIVALLQATVGFPSSLW